MIGAILENRLLAGWAAVLPRAPGQIGAIHEADAELVPLGDGRLLALTVDAVQEEVAAGLYRQPRTVGRMAATASLSDLAAVGADPIGLLTSVGLPAGAAEAVQAGVAQGLAEVCRAAGTFVLGGDTGEQADLSVTCVAVGTVPEDEAVRRIGARPGDLIFASGPLGLGSALAASVFLGLDAVAEAEFAPPLRLSHGRALRGIASACIDTSDGLIAALDQLMRLNEAAARLEAPLEAILHPQARRVQELSGLPALPFVAAQQGEYELLFTVPEPAASRLHEAAARLGWKPLRLGRVVAGSGVAVGGRALDTAAIRNLWADVGGDVGRYVEGLCAAAG